MLVPEHTHCTSTQILTSLQIPAFTTIEYSAELLNPSDENVSFKFVRLIEPSRCWMRDVEVVEED